MPHWRVKTRSLLTSQMFASFCPNEKNFCHKIICPLQKTPRSFNHLFYLIVEVIHKIPDETVLVLEPRGCIEHIMTKSNEERLIYIPCDNEIEQTGDNKKVKKSNYKIN